ncbi:CotO family spore coat protein [Lysinibacillus sphaericus]
MKKDKSSNKEPLLYIQQPKLQEVKGNMQVVYRSSKRKEKKEVKPARPIENKTDSQKFDSGVSTSPPVSGVSEIAKETTPAPEAAREDSRPPTQAFRRLPPFKELSLEEKLEYINASINGKVPFPCEFSTDHDTYKGILTTMSETAIKIKTFRGEEVEVAKDSLKSIKMIGLH